MGANIRPVLAESIKRIVFFYKKLRYGDGRQVLKFSGHFATMFLTGFLIFSGHELFKLASEVK